MLPSFKPSHFMKEQLLEWIFVLMLQIMSDRLICKTRRRSFYGTYAMLLFITIYLDLYSAFLAEALKGTQLDKYK